MVNELLKKSINGVLSKQTNILSAAFFIIATTVLTQILGIVKYRLLVSVFGASNNLGVFLASFRIPDFIFQVFIASSVSSIFIPLFSEFIGERREEGDKFASSFIILSSLFFIALSLVIAIFAHPLSRLVAPGFSEKEILLMSSLTRIILFSGVFLLIATIFSSILQSFHHFFLPGIASSLYNLGIIIGVVIFSPHIGIYGAALGVMLGTLLFLLAQIPLLVKLKFKFFFTLNSGEVGTKAAILAIPKILTSTLFQISSLLNIFFASFISARSFVIFDLAQTLFMAPAILLGQSIAQASFPSLSQKRERKDEFANIFLSSFNQILYLTLPISALLIVLRIPVVRLFFGARQFDWEATVETGLTLSFFAISLFAQSLSYLIARAFYAQRDTKTPFWISAISLVFNAAIAYFFVLVQRLPIPYLAFSITLANILSFILMMLALDKKITLPKFNLALSTTKILIATFIMGISLYIPIKLLDRLVFDTTRTINLIFLTGIASFIGFSSYIFLTWLLDIKEAYYITEMIKSINKPQKLLSQIRELIFEPPKAG